MNDVVERALGTWGLVGSDVRLVAARENAVYEVSRGQDRVALRLHRQGYRTDAELRSELTWMAAMSEAGVSVPAPIRARDGAFLHDIGGVQVDVLTWLTGATMIDALETLEPTDQPGAFFGLGQEMARLHQACDAWAPPPDFERVHWDRNGLLGNEPLWDRFWENPDLTDADRKLASAFRDEASLRLAAIETDLDYGLVHADLVPANVLIDGAGFRLIDFDDGGFGYRLFDVATSLLKRISEPQYPRLQSSLLAGYLAIRPLDVSELDLFLALRAATYVGWNIKRMQEPGGVERNDRFIRTFRRLATRYLPAAY